jgi:hypothetical protein
MAIWHIGWKPTSWYDSSHKRWRSGAAIKANPLRGGDAKPMGLFQRERWPGYRKGYQHAIGVILQGPKIPLGKDLSQSFRTRGVVLKGRLILLVPLLALFAFVEPTEDRAEAATWGCMGKDIKPGNDIDNIINNDPSGTATTFCVDAGTYQVSAPAILKAGDKLIGQPGTKPFVQKCTPSCVNTNVPQPIPVVKLVGSGTDNLLRARGNPIFISWVDLSGASGTGTGSGAITAGSAGSDFVVEFARIHDNASLGISNMKGTVRDSEFFRNSLKQSSLGFNGSAVKGITEYEAARVFVHDEQGNGLWCDVGCSDDPARGTKGYYVHDSVVVNNGRGGIRYENSMSTAWFENNEIHGNGRTERRGGVDIRDSQHATVKSNVFGGATFSFISPENKAVTVTYPQNGERIGIRATDSGRSDRVDLKEVVVRDNLMNNERIVTCGGPVACINNSGVGSR